MEIQDTKDITPRRKTLKPRWCNYHTGQAILTMETQLLGPRSRAVETEKANGAGTPTPKNFQFEGNQSYNLLKGIWHQRIASNSLPKHI